MGTKGEVPGEGPKLRQLGQLTLVAPPAFRHGSTRAQTQFSAAGVDPAPRIGPSQHAMCEGGASQATGPPKEVRTPPCVTMYVDTLLNRVAMGDADSNSCVWQVFNF